MTAVIVPDFKENGQWVKQRGGEDVRIQTLAARTWYAMRDRCKVGGKFQSRKPSYTGCTMAEEFEDFQRFAEWCQGQVGYGLDGYALEKDLLSDTKCYSPATCVFVPPVINNLFHRNEAVRGEYPIGVVFHKKSGKLMGRLKMYGKTAYLGLFDTVESASKAYKQAKEAYVKDVADKYRDTLDPRVYNLLMTFEMKEV